MGGLRRTAYGRISELTIFALISLKREGSHSHGIYLSIFSHKAESRFSLTGPHSPVLAKFPRLLFFGKNMV
ncbi:MAG: hypothetical protein A3D44_04045 [Candidatus Staskawiczbacteria bacterium RIFCSPHIGHO2_02_FULL_42_22]|uniref:Uncharacterized protein n=1 Tax=Candidatus Staskawiczbacteria bacterium RIFCSPHIGHO2_02_FULL_42_22 TaxID=1802207 RepID=A0A1G2I1V9_9BACT|nr:MAG: hypothetical protein A3D44_04045 [Candidatus Staskawiczbacteria bacterium RIFCSPHIGHO2_02_FULL_42_22]